MEESPDQTVRDSVVFSMANMKDFEALQFIVNSPDIDEILKMGAIDRNYALLRDVLLQQPSAQDVKFISNCMEILPIQELREPLLAAKSKVPALFDTQSEQQFSRAIQKIDREGIAANPKWEE